MDLQALWVELTTDPEGVGYLSPTNPANDGGNASLLNDTVVQVEREFLNGTDLLEATVLSDLVALAQAQRELYIMLYTGPEIRVTTGSNGRTILGTLFGAGTQTRTNLIALAAETISRSRAEALGLGRVYTQDIETARSRYGGG